MCQDEKMRILADAIACLSTEQRRVVIMRHIEGMSFSEIAEKWKRRQGPAECYGYERWISFARALKGEGLNSMTGDDPKDLPPLSEKDQEELGLILDAYLAQLEQGSAPDIDALCDSNPSLANSIRHYVSSLHLLHNVAQMDSDKPIKPDHYESKRLGDYS